MFASCCLSLIQQLRSFDNPAAAACVVLVCVVVVDVKLSHDVTDDGGGNTELLAYSDPSRDVFHPDSSVPSNSLFNLCVLRCF